MNTRSHGRTEAQATISPTEFEEDRMQRSKDGSTVVVGSSQSQTTSSAAAPTAGCTQLRECCDFCTLRKRKCDGDGANPCSFCIAKKRTRCHYSLRLPLGPRPDPSSSANGKAEKRASSGAEAGHSTWRAPVAHRIADTGGDVIRRKAASRRVGTRTMTLKRTRFGPSSATGLVGTRENDYLGDFFRILGFFPLATQSAIRKAMVETIFTAGNGWHNPNGSPAVGGTSPAVDAIRIPSEVVNLAASTSTLWSTIALGALVEGRPTSLATRYLRLARQSLGHCFDSESIEIARAFTNMALVYGFTGEEVKSRKNLQFAEEIVEALPRDQATEDLFDCLCFLKLNGMYACTRDSYRLRCGAELQQENFIQDGTRHFPKVPRVYHQSSLCRLIIETEVNITRAFFYDMAKHDVFDEEEGTASAASSKFFHAAEFNERYGDAGSTIAADSSQMGEHAFGAPCRTRPRTSEHGEELPPPPGERSRKFAEDMSREFELHEDAFSSPEMKDGAGSLLFNSISSYLNGLCGKLDKASEKFVRTCKILESHPGLMRYGFWEHVAHCVLGVLSRRPDPDGYESMRAAFNLVRDEPGAVLAPPFGEWRGMHDLCDRVFCRSTYGYLFTTSLPGANVSDYIKDDSLDISQVIDHEAKVLRTSGIDSAKVATSVREFFPAPITDANKLDLPLPTNNPGTPNLSCNELGTRSSAGESNEPGFVNSAPKAVNQQGNDEVTAPPRELPTRYMDRLLPWSMELGTPPSTATRNNAMPSGYGSRGGYEIRTSDRTSARQPVIHDDECESESAQGDFSNTSKKRHADNAAFMPETPAFFVLEKMIGDDRGSRHEYRFDDLGGKAAPTPSSMHVGEANNKLLGVEDNPKQQGSYVDDTGTRLLQHARTDQSRYGCFSNHDDAGADAPAGSAEDCQRQQTNERVPDPGRFFDAMGGGGMVDKFVLEDDLDGTGSLFPSLDEAMEHFA